MRARIVLTAGMFRWGAMGEREKSNKTNEANEADEKEGHNFGNHPSNLLIPGYSL